MQESGSPKERVLEPFLWVYYVTQEPFQLQKHGGLMATGDRLPCPPRPLLRPWMWDRGFQCEYTSHRITYARGG